MGVFVSGLCVFCVKEHKVIFIQYVCLSTDYNIIFQIERRQGVYYKCIPRNSYTERSI